MSDSKIIMSEELQGLIPDLEDAIFDYGAISVVHCEISGQEKAFYGPLVRFSFNERLKVELKTATSIALAVYKNKDWTIFDRIKVIYRDELMSFEGPFRIHKFKIRDVKQQEQICMLRLSFVPVVKE